MRLINGPAQIFLSSIRMSGAFSKRRLHASAGFFYFIDDKFFIDFPDEKLMKNKETINGIRHGRPVFYSFKDEISDLFWVIPISSQTQKFKAIYQKKIKNGKPCDTIVFGQVLGADKVFLIQNMHLSPTYITDTYMDSRNAPVRIDRRLEAELKTKSKKVLKLYRSGYSGLIFPDVLKIEQAILNS